MNIQNEQKCVNMALESAYAKGKKDAIEKACDALYGLMNNLGCDLMDIEKAKDYVRNAMEE